MRWSVNTGDSLEWLRTLPDNSIDSIVTDPPYGLGKEPDALAMLRDWIETGHHDVKGRGFMGKDWDAFVPQPALWRECLRVLKPGGYLLAFGGTRTIDLVVIGLRIAGFEVRDQLQWIFATGFPKSARVNSDPRFCQCGEAARSDESTAHEQGVGAHKSTGRDPSGGDHSLGGALRLTNTAQDSPGGYRQDHDSGGGQPRHYEVAARSSLPSPRYVQGRSRSVSPGGDSGRESGRIPSQAQHTDHPASTDCSCLTEDDDGRTDKRGRHTSPAGRTCTVRHTPDSLENLPCSEYGHAFPPCQVCGKPDATGYGTATKPAYEPIAVCRKPLDGTVAANVLKWGTGAVNVDGCRVGTGGVPAWSYPNGAGGSRFKFDDTPNTDEPEEAPTSGRWPTNLLLSHTPYCSDECLPGCPVEEMGRQSGERVSGSAGYEGAGSGDGARHGIYHKGLGGKITATHDDTGTAARFFPRFRYIAKPSTAEREAGVTREPADATETVGRELDSAGVQNPRAGAGRGAGTPIYECSTCGLNLGGGRAATKCTDGGDHTRVMVGRGKGRANTHPTVKPISLMRWLVRLVTPPGGLVLDPFTGSGTTGCAAMLEGFRFTGCELDPVHVEIAEDRIRFWENVDPDSVTGEDGDTTRTPKPESVDERQTTLFGGDL